MKQSCGRHRLTPPTRLLQYQFDARRRVSESHLPQRHTSLHRRQNGGLRRLGHARPIFLAGRRASHRPQERRGLRCQPHGRDRHHRPRGAPAHRFRHHQRRRRLQPARSNTPACSTNMADSWTTSGPQSRRRPLLPVCQRLQPGKGLRAHPRSQPLRRRSGFASQARLRADRNPGSRRARHAAKTDAGRSGRDPLLLVHRRRGLTARRHASHAPVIPARTASKSTSTPPKRRGIWNEILEAGQEFGIKPCGLGARNTLRLEAKMALYGHEIHASITPLEADLDWIVKLDKGDFVGRGRWSGKSSRASRAS